MLLKRKIKILVDAHMFDKSFQGSVTYLQGLYNALVEFNDVEITICANDLDNAKQYFKDDRFRFVMLKTNSRIKRLVFEYPAIIKKGNYDYAHFTYTAPFFKPCKYIVTVHDILFLEFRHFFSWSYRLVKGFFFKKSAQQADIVLTISQYSKKALSRIFKINSQTIFVLPIAVEIPKTVPVDIKAKYQLDKYILYVSRFEPRKNHVGLLAAYVSLALYEKGYELVFIGSKSEKIEQKAYQHLLTQIPDSLQGKVNFFENVSQNELINFYQQAACSVYPSFAEGFGIPPIEAGINNCKVLCSNLTALADFDFFKYHFDPTDGKIFKDKLEQILKDENYPYHQIRDEIIKRYNWNEIARNYYAIIQKNSISL